MGDFAARKRTRRPHASRIAAAAHATLPRTDSSRGRRTSSWRLHRLQIQMMRDVTMLDARSRAFLRRFREKHRGRYAATLSRATAHYYAIRFALLLAYD